MPPLLAAVGRHSGLRQPYRGVGGSKSELLRLLVLNKHLLILRIYPRTCHLALLELIVPRFVANRVIEIRLHESRESLGLHRTCSNPRIQMVADARII